MKYIKLLTPATNIKQEILFSIVTKMNPAGFAY